MYGWRIGATHLVNCKYPVIVLLGRRGECRSPIDLYIRPINYSDALNILYIRFTPFDFNLYAEHRYITFNIVDIEASYRMRKLLFGAALEYTNTTVRCCVYII